MTEEIQAIVDRLQGLIHDELATDMALSGIEKEDGSVDLRFRLLSGDEQDQIPMTISVKEGW